MAASIDSAPFVTSITPPSPPERTPWQQFYKAALVQLAARQGRLLSLITWGVVTFLTWCATRLGFAANPDTSAWISSTGGFVAAWIVGTIVAIAQGNGIAAIQKTVGVEPDRYAGPQTIAAVKQVAVVAETQKP